MSATANSSPNLIEICMPSTIHRITYPYHNLQLCHKAWDGMVMRVGDQSSLLATQGQDRKQLTTMGFLHDSWKYVRQRETRPDGKCPVIGASHRQQNHAAILSSFFARAQRQKITTDLDFKGDESVFVRWHHDATPMMLEFGACSLSWNRVRDI